MHQEALIAMDRETTEKQKERRRVLREAMIDEEAEEEIEV